MDAKTGTGLPWDALRNSQGDSPWAALKQFAGAVAADRDVLEHTLNLYDKFMETAYERKSFQCLYVPAMLVI